MQTLEKIPTPWISKATEARVAQMTLLEKIGQMTQVEKNSLKPGDVKRLALGSVLSGGGGNPTPNNPETWRSMVEAFQEEALSSRLGIPLLYGSDGVHGHNNVVGATIFPHNIGLGCTRDADLVRRIARVTALECVATGVRWDFAPAVSIPRDIRWGRSYEGYSQDAVLVAKLATAYVEGLKGKAWNLPTSVLPSVKHFIADGATKWGTSTRSDRVNLETDRTMAIAKMGEDFVAMLDRGAWQLDQGASTLPESILRAEDLSGYAATIAAGALNVMVSYSSWMGTRMHEHKYLLTNVLKGELGFQGFLVSDWEAVQQLPNDFYGNVVSSINAGLDMIMVPFDFEGFISTLERAVVNGDVSLARIDDAVSRILHAKEALGLFEHPRTDAKLLEKVGSAKHRAVALEAVQKSLVLLKNDFVLPLSRDTRLLVAGQAAHDVGLQCGGWSITWMGEAGATTPGTTILEGLQSQAAENMVVYDLEGTGEERFEVGLVVLSEATYAEGMGDRFSLELNTEQKALLERVRTRCEKMVVVLISGRPLIVTNEIANWDTFVAAWLPGTEGAGVADVLYGEKPFTGKLGFHWAESHDDIPLTPSSKALFELGFGLTTDGEWY
jgi:beta-glucosidase